MSLPEGYWDGLIRLGLGIPRGYLDGKADADFAQIRLRREMARTDPKAALAPVAGTRERPAVSREAADECYRQAVAALSSRGDAQGRVLLGEAITWLNALYGLATGHPASAAPASDVVASDVEAIEVAERLAAEKKKSKAPRAAAGAKRR